VIAVNATETIAPPAPSMFSSVETMSIAEPDDHELMLAVRNGDLARLGTLFERHHGPLYGFFVRLTNQRTASEDLVQLVFYRILKYRHTYRDEGKFTAWMYHLARRVAADHFRKSRYQSSELDLEDIAESVADDAMHLAQRAAVNDDLQLMREAFSHLDPQEREILTLQRFQHLAHDEIARVLDCSVGAAKVRAHRALKSLREIFLRLRGREGTALT
jgi:RNA polymerase sigma-70 factor (ECF subfamily)